MTADWIRASLDAIRIAKTAHKPPSGPRSSVCNHPGCGRAILSDSATGLCRDHMHKSGCRCRQCAGAKGGRR